MLRRVVTRLHQRQYAHSRRKIQQQQQQHERLHSHHLLDRFPVTAAAPACAAGLPGSSSTCQFSSSSSGTTDLVSEEKSDNADVVEARRKLVLLDFLPLVYKSYYASVYFDFSLPFSKVYGENATLPPETSDYAALGGASQAPLVPLSTVFFFTKSIVQLVNTLEHDAIVCARDGPTNDRKLLYPEYKQTRTPMPTGLKQQIPLCLEVLASLGIPVVYEPGVEADDLLATIATNVAVERGDWDAVVVSPDKDLLQVATMDGSISMYNVHKQEVVTFADAQEQFGVEPPLIPLVQSLSGDRVDNIPGVPGIGPKTAAKLIREHGSLEAVVECARDGGLTPKLRKNVLESASMLPVYHRLVSLRLDAAEGLPPRFQVDEVAAPDLDAQPFRDMLERLNFRSVAKNVENLKRNKIAAKQKVEHKARRMLREDDRLQFEGGGGLVQDHSLHDEFSVEPVAADGVVSGQVVGSPPGARQVECQDMDEHSEEDGMIFK